MKKFLLAILIISISSCSPIKVACGADTYMVPRNATKGYETYVKTTDYSIKGLTKLFDVIEASGSDFEISVKKKVEQLQEDLNQFGARQNKLLQASFQTYVTGVCDKDVRDSHLQLLAKEGERSAKIAEIESELKQLVDQKGLAGPPNEEVSNELNKLEALILTE